VRFIAAMKQVIAPVAEAGNDFDIFAGPADRLDLVTASEGSVFTPPAASEWSA
jgi:hypothetical protein